MLSDLIVVDDVFKNPELIEMFSRSQKFYTWDEHPESKHKTYDWPGQHSTSVHSVDESMYQLIMNEIFNKTINQFLNIENPDNNFFNYSFNYKSQLHAELLTEEYKYSPLWIHKNIEYLYSGTIFLSPNPPADSGIAVYRNHEKTVIDNVFNRLVLYKPQYFHSDVKGFGTTVADGRMVLTLNIKKITFDLAHQSIGE
jgi:hypothetical protein